jgi:predicted nucleic acid-binding protein
MNRVVVDASVAVKWFLPEVHGAAAARLLNEQHGLCAPDLLFAEVGNALWKRVRGGEIVKEDAVAALGILDTVPIEIYPSKLLMASAMEIACATGRTVYDSLYLALAVLLDSRIVTADRKLHDAIKTGFLAERVW